MKNLPVVALPEVEADLRLAMVHYGSWHADGAEQVRRKYDETVGWIGWNPDAFPKKHGGIRRAVMKRSYYIVYFIEERERAIILAVLDGRRAPEEIRELLRLRKK